MSRRVKVGIMIALLALTVGFAAITTTLVINGTLSIGPDGEGFDADVIFSRAKISRGTGTAFISSDGKSLNFTADLMELGGEVDLRYDVLNKNRQYDAKGKVSCDFVDETNAYNGYITITETPEDFAVDGGSKFTGHVIVRLVKSFAGDETINSANIEFKCTIDLEANEREDLAPEVPPIYTDSELNGADPVITGGLIPINLTTDGKVIYADAYDKWYDYSTKRWANAVLLEDAAMGRYEEGDVIKEEDIRSYFVWVPRYRYKLWNVDGTNVVNSTIPDTITPQTIEIQFETKNVEPSTGTKNGEWLTHPAFTTFDVNGIWVSKYETAYRNAKNTGDAYRNTSQPENIVSKPNTYSWHHNALTFIFKNAYNFNRNLDSHMIKNTEWGAVAYLSHSEYGINGEIRVNNRTRYITGFASTEAPTCVVSSAYTKCNRVAANADLTYTRAYNEDGGALASTTGNITGVYDMSGLFPEYVAAYVEGGNLTYLSMKTAELATYEKYFDIYPNNSTKTSYQNRILGDATGEMGPFYNFADDDGIEKVHNGWYGDTAEFIDSTNSIFVRGGSASDGILAGQFNFRAGTGIYDSIGSRVVLAPQ